MDLKDFISETLTQIVAGVKQAQADTVAHGGVINPRLSATADLAIKHGLFIARGGSAQLVQFDVALTAHEGTGTKGGIGVVAGIVSLGSAGQSQTDNTSVSRVKFLVPVTLPETDR